MLAGLLNIKHSWIYYGSLFPGQGSIEFWYGSCEGQHAAKQRLSRWFLPVGRLALHVVTKLLFMIFHLRFFHFLAGTATSRWRYASGFAVVTNYELLFL